MTRPREPTNRRSMRGSVVVGEYSVPSGGDDLARGRVGIVTSYGGSDLEVMLLCFSGASLPICGTPKPAGILKKLLVQTKMHSSCGGTTPSDTHLSEVQYTFVGTSATLCVVGLDTAPQGSPSTLSLEEASCSRAILIVPYW